MAINLSSSLVAVVWLSRGPYLSTNCWPRCAASAGVSQDHSAPRARMATQAVPPSRIRSSTEYGVIGCWGMLPRTFRSCRSSWHIGAASGKPYELMPTSMGDTGSVGTKHDTCRAATPAAPVCSRNVRCGVPVGRIMHAAQRDTSTRCVTTTAAVTRQGGTADRRRQRQGRPVRRMLKPSSRRRRLRIAGLCAGLPRLR